ncbi:hypothetical protein [Sphingomonas aracearum]|uniref:Uncharacterized protein n=1 Tax=Sphingomonas aracearum TaxID=2283317 RepID=A0A369VQM7_9SPHN|nr:hypothetical protein [Sphingomonas aracearum]RDE04698.1 hypothetical protein DVW87_14005 [Sphingomonas aracearum]
MGILPLTLLAFGMAIGALMALCGSVFLAAGKPISPKWMPLAPFLAGLALYLACAATFARAIGA